MLKKVEVVVSALRNYFNMEYGSVWTKPHLGNLFDDIIFESLRDWQTQKKLERDILSGIRSNFKGLFIDNNSISFEVDTTRRELNISITVEILESREQLDFVHKLRL